MRIVFLVVTILAVALGLLVGTLNSGLAQLDLLWVQLEWPLGLLILCAAAVGFLFGALFTWLFAVLPLRARARKARLANANPGP
ncbi:MAG: LapA family protein [Lysobacterales bacterium]|jgi:uncharacterized integral membrane protein